MIKIIRHRIEALPANRLVLLLILLSIVFKSCILIITPTDDFLLENDSKRYLSLANNFGIAFFGGNANYNWDAFYITPGYPFYLSLFGDLEIKQIIFSQFCILGATQFLLFKILRRHFSPILSMLGLVIYLIESSSNLESFHILTETLFVFFFVLFLFTLSKTPISKKGAIVAGTFLGISLMIRPVAQILVISLLASIVFLKERLKLISCIVVVLAFLSGWTLRNYAVYGVPQLSGIQSLNLLYFEGAGALSHSTSTTFEQAQVTENEREVLKLGKNPTLKEVVEYRQQRGISLIKSHTFGFIKLHIVGSIKILLGPGAATIRELTTALPFSSQLGMVFIITGVLLSSFLAFFSFISILLLRDRKQSQISFLYVFSLISFALLLFSSSGANAYSRFRVPLVPLEIILSMFAIKFVSDKLLRK